MGYPERGFILGAMTRSVHTRAYKTLVGALVEARRSAEVTQAALAKKLNRPQSFISKYEQCERRLDLIEFLEIVLALGCNPAEMLASAIRELSSENGTSRDIKVTKVDAN